MLYGNERWFMRYFNADGGGSAAALTPGSGDPAAAAAAAAASGSGGDQKPFWECFTDPAVKDLMKVKDYAGVNALGMAYYNLNKLQNGAKDVIGIPKDANDAAAWDKLHTALGRPGKIEDYKFTFEKDAKVHPKMEAFAKELFFGMGASSEKAQAGVAKWQNLVTEIMTEQANEEKTANDNAIAALKTQWGNSWDANIAAGQAAVKAMGLPDTIFAGLDKAVGVASVLQLFATIGKKLGVETPTIDTPNNGGGNGFQAMTPETAKAEIQRLSNDKVFQESMFDIKNTERQANVARWTKLHEIAYPSRK